MNEDDKYYNIVIALAGALQAAALVESFAQQGKADPRLVETQLNSLFILSPNDAVSIYGKEDNLKMGLALVSKVFDTASGKQYAQCMHYMMAMIYLQNKLRRNTKMCDDIQSRITGMQHQVEHLKLMHPTVVDNLADLYMDTISTYQFRVQVRGKPEYLEQAGIMSVIRALLFSGVRASLLWHQVGGRRLQFLFSRGRILHTALDILTYLHDTDSASHH